MEVIKGGCGLTQIATFDETEVTTCTVTNDVGSCEPSACTALSCRDNAVACALDRYCA